MEPFTILCSTCQSRIRVRNASMIGQLANCPKCNSMIMITPPQKIQVESAGGGPVDSMALTKEAIAPDLSGGEEHSPRDPAGPAGGAAPASEAGPSPDEYRLAEEDVPPAPPASHAEPAQPDWQPQQVPLVPTEEWTNPSTAKKQQYLLVAVVGLSGIAFAAVLFVLFLNWYGQSSAPTPLANANPVEAASTLNDSSTDTTPENPGQVDDAADAAADATNTNDIPPGVEPDPSEPPTTAEPSLPIAPEAQPSATEAAVTPDSPPADPTPPPAPAVMPDEQVTEPEGAPELPKQLQLFAPMLSYELQPVIPDTLVLPSAPPVTAEELQLTGGGDGDSLPDVDWTAQSQLALPGIIIRNRPLSEAINLWTVVSGVPTQLDFESLAAAGIDREQAVDFQRAEPQTLGELANLLAQSVGLVLQSEENRFLTLRAPAEAVTAKVPPAMKIDDLLPDAEGEQWLQAALTLLVPGSEAGWTIADGQISADPQHLDWVTWHAILRLLDGWRTLSGQASQLTGYPKSSLSVALVDPTALAALETQLTRYTLQAEPVGQSISSICADAGLQCWIDWPHVAAAGLGPHTTATVVTHARSLRHALADYANKYSLVAAVLDERSIWLTTPRRYRASPRLFVLPSQGRTVEQWQQQLRPLTPVGPQGVGRIDIVATPDGAYLWVRCCLPTIQL